MMSSLTNKNNKSSRKNDYEQRLHRTLSRYGKNKRPSNANLIVAQTHSLNININNNHKNKHKHEQRAIRTFQASEFRPQQIRLKREISNGGGSTAQESIFSEKYSIQLEKPSRSSQDNLKYIDDSTDNDETPTKNDSSIKHNDICDNEKICEKYPEDQMFDDLDGCLFEYDDIRRIFPAKTTVNRSRNRFIWRCLGLKFSKSYRNSISKDEIWPFFTYYLIIVEIITMIILSMQGIAPLTTETKVSGIIWHQTISYQSASYYKHPNIWYGPSYSNLILNGAKFTPCMRNDRNIIESMEKLKLIENEYGCCLRNDLSGCVPTSSFRCSNHTSYWIKSLNESGPLCGNDPKYCLDKSSPNDNNDVNQQKNITDFPICHRFDFEAINQSKDIHMKCQVQARPCCIGIYGKCILASEEYCDFMEGHYHADANLCSQINCMKDVCGSFLFPRQYVRLILSLFIHAGWIQLLINIAIKWIYMRRLEQLLSYKRTIWIYFISGIGGNFASAIFLPMIPDVGSNPSLFGIISFLFIESVRQKSHYGWRIILHLLAVLIVLFLPGLFLPFIDIYSILFGFIYGALIIIFLHPLNVNNHKYRYSALLAMIIITLILLFLFIKDDLLDNFYDYFNYLNCLPPFFNCSNIDIAYAEIKALN